MFGKLVNGLLVTYSPPVLYDGKEIYTNDPEILLAFGWKELIFTEVPRIPEGYYPELSWEETETNIVRVWTLRPMPN